MAGAQNPPFFFFASVIPEYVNKTLNKCLSLRDINKDFSQKDKKQKFSPKASIQLPPNWIPVPKHFPEDG